MLTVGVLSQVIELHMLARKPLCARVARKSSVIMNDMTVFLLL
jgi:hypothetical protein